MRAAFARAAMPSVLISKFANDHFVAMYSLLRCGHAHDCRLTESSVATSGYRYDRGEAECAYGVTLDYLCNREPGSRRLSMHCQFGGRPMIGGHRQTRVSAVRLVLADISDDP